MSRYLGLGTKHPRTLEEQLQEELRFACEQWVVLSSGLGHTLGEVDIRSITEPETYWRLVRATGRTLRLINARYERAALESLIMLGRMDEVIRPVVWEVLQA